MAQRTIADSSDPRVASRRRETMNDMCPSVSYLGRGLDATKPPEIWWSKLDGYDIDPVIDIAGIDGSKFSEARGEAKPRPFYAKDVKSACKKFRAERQDSFSASLSSDIVLGFECAACALIRNESKRGLWLCKKEVASETVSLHRYDTGSSSGESNESETGVITRVHYSTFEKELYEYIASEMKLAVESDTDFIEAVKELDDAIRKEDSNDEEKQKLAKACYSFIEGKQVTHYVHSITLGAAFGGLSKFKFSWMKPKALLIRKLHRMMESELGDRTFHRRPQTAFLRKDFCGIMPAPGELTSEAIIECSIKPISTLITMEAVGEFFKKELSSYANNHTFSK